MTNEEHEIERLQARLKESEAGASAMRKVIEDIYGEEGPLPKLFKRHFAATDTALCASAGKELLAKLERYHRALLFIQNDRYTTKRAREVATEALKLKET